MANVVIIKQHKREAEVYNEAKLFASIRAACLAVRTPVGEAETTAKRICQHVIDWLESKGEVTSLDVRLRAAQHLHTYNPDAAYIYAHPVV